MSYNQEVKADAGKLRLSLVPRKIIWKIARIREYGTAKYHDPDNWKNVEVERYRDAAYRHFMAYLDDPNTTMTKLARMFVKTVGTTVFKTMNNIATGQSRRTASPKSADS